MKGYKARCLERLQAQGLPVLRHKVFQEPITPYEINQFRSESDDPARRWGVRADLPYKSDGLLFFVNHGENGREILSTSLAYKRMKAAYGKNQELSFILSDSPEHGGRNFFNAVVWCEDDIMFGELCYDPCTLRKAWVAGNLKSFCIDNSVGDYIRNRKTINLESISALRKIRNLIMGTRKSYELTHLPSGKLVFWQEDSDLVFKGLSEQFHLWL